MCLCLKSLSVDQWKNLEESWFRRMQEETRKMQSCVEICYNVEQAEVSEASILIKTTLHED